MGSLDGPTKQIGIVVVMEYQAGERVHRLMLRALLLDGDDFVGTSRDAGLVLPVKTLTIDPAHASIDRD